MQISNKKTSKIISFLDKFLSAFMVVVLFLAIVGMYNNKSIYEPVTFTVTVFMFYISVRLFQKSQ